MTRPAGAVAGLLAAGVLAGCFAAARPPLELYRLRAPSAADSTSSRPQGWVGAAPLEGWLVVDPYVTPGLYAEPQIVYRIGETTYGAYPNREWALPLSTMLGSLTVEILRESDALAGRVTDDPAVLGPESLIWRGKVGEFEEVDRDEHVSVAVHLDAMLLRASDDSVLWRGSARLERPVTDPTMPAIVDAFAALASDAITRLARQAEGAVRAYASRPPPRGRN
jgi:ABC-type uncharacterized transport system auxiliary subunit